MHMQRKWRDKEAGGEPAAGKMKYVKPAMEKVVIPRPEEKDFHAGCTCCTCGCS